MSVPIYLSGAIKAELWKERPDLFGALLTPQMGNRIPEGLIWGADNGCFNPKVSARFKADEYLAWLASRPGRDSCLFASAPDGRLSSVRCRCCRVSGPWAFARRLLGRMEWAS
jgi:hypothetical protein